MAIRASGLDYKNLAAYFVEGITWSRFREIATRAPGDGGLQLFRLGSRADKNLFGCSPSAIISTRPQTDLNFLKLLQGKEHLFHRIAARDLEQRPTLEADTKKAVECLGEIQLRVNRSILAEIIERCLFLMHWNAKHNKVVERTSWDELHNQAVSHILNLEISEHVLGRLKYTADDVAALDPRPRTWVELAVLQIVGEQALVEDRLKEALDFHRMVTDQASAHLSLILDNTFRTPWLAAKLLSTDKQVAQAAAKALSRHIASTRPSNRTLFEKHVFDTEHLWRNLVEFADAEPPVLLWQRHGQFENLFKFLAPRFLLAPDNVLDCERTHARWQWACSNQRSLKIHSLNASLRIVFYLENNDSFPSHETLWPHLDAERAEHRLSMRDIVAEDEIAPGWR